MSSSRRFILEYLKIRDHQKNQTRLPCLHDRLYGLLNGIMRVSMVETKDFCGYKKEDLIDWKPVAHYLIAICGFRLPMFVLLLAKKRKRESTIRGWRILSAFRERYSIVSALSECRDRRIILTVGSTVFAWKKRFNYRFSTKRTAVHYDFLMSPPSSNSRVAYPHKVGMRLIARVAVEPKYRKVKGLGTLVSVLYIFINVYYIWFFTKKNRLD